MARFIGSTNPPTTGTPYNSGARQTGAGDRIVGLVFSDTAGNLYVDQSGDGTNWDYTDSVAVAAGAGQKISVELVAPYYRVRYVPTTNPVAFRLTARQSSAGARP